MEQLLSGNTESSSTGTHGAVPSFYPEQLQWSIMESESTHGSSAGSTYNEQIIQ